MSKTLYVPDHVAEKEKERKKSVYVKKDEKVLDPSLLDVSLSERLPQPTGWRLLVMPYMGRATKISLGRGVPGARRETGFVLAAMLVLDLKSKAVRFVLLMTMRSLLRSLNQMILNMSRKEKITVENATCQKKNRLMWEIPKNLL